MTSDKSSRENQPLLRSFLSKRFVLYLASAAFVVVLIHTAVTLQNLHSQLDGLVILDVRAPFIADGGFLPWSGEAAAAVFDRLGEAGRVQYSQFILYADLVFSVLIAPLFFMAVLVRLYQNEVFLIGGLPGIWDTLENISVVILLAQYPLQPAFVIAVGPYFTAFKVVSIVLTLAAILVGVSMKIHKRLKRGS